ncbi:hypothetical protein [Amycolatopsis sp. NPDC003861]
MKRATDAIRLLTAALLGISAGIGLVHNVRRLVREEAAAMREEKERP